MAGTRTGDLANVRYNDGPNKHPSFGVFAGDSPFQYVLALGLVQPKKSVVAPNYSHIDISFASPKQNSGKPETVTENIADFVIRSLARA